MSGGASCEEHVILALLTGLHAFVWLFWATTWHITIALRAIVILCTSARNASQTCILSVHYQRFLAVMAFLAIMDVYIERE